MTINIGANVRIHKLSLCIGVILLVLLYLYAIRESSYLTSKVNDRGLVSLRSLVASAIKAAEIGGLEVIAVHETAKLSVESKGKTKEGIDDPVTAADLRSHCAMYYYLSTNYPTLTIISEEKSQGCDAVTTPKPIDETTILEEVDGGYDVAVSADDITVWIDPLDATKEFTENLLEYVTTMVCVAVKGTPVIGVIHKPFQPKQTYWAWAYHGFSSNLHNLSTTKAKKPVLIVSRSHAGRVNNASKAALGDDVHIISAAGAGFKSLEVAVGNATAYIHMTAIKKWDVCAGAAIISALGGAITSLSGEPMTDFGSTDAIVLEHGLLATMTDHVWYLEKFYTP